MRRQNPLFPAHSGPLGASGVGSAIPGRPAAAVHSGANSGIGGVAGYLDKQVRYGQNQRKSGGAGLGAHL